MRGRPKLLKASNNWGDAPPLPPMEVRADFLEKKDVRGTRKENSARLWKEFEHDMFPYNVP